MAGGGWGNKALFFHQAFPNIYGMKQQLHLWVFFSMVLIIWKKQISFNHECTVFQNVWKTGLGKEVNQNHNKESIYAINIQRIIIYSVGKSFGIREINGSHWEQKALNLLGFPYLLGREETIQHRMVLLCSWTNSGGQVSLSPTRRGFPVKIDSVPCAGLLCPSSKVAGASG